MATVVTTITGLSTSAIATNGFVRGGRQLFSTDYLVNGPRCKHGKKGLYFELIPTLCVTFPLCFQVELIT